MQFYKMDNNTFQEGELPTWSGDMKTCLTERKLVVRLDGILGCDGEEKGKWSGL